MNTKILSLLVVLASSYLQASTPAGIIRFNAAPFGAGSLARDVALQADGKIVACGYTTVGGFTRFTVARFMSYGALDTTFNPSGNYPGVVQETGFGDSDQEAFSLVINSVGKIIVAGKTGSWTVIQYNIDGSHDTGFNGTGIVQTGGNTSYASAITLDPTNQKPFVAGNIGGTLTVMRYSTAGTQEATSTGISSPTIAENSNNLLGITVNNAAVVVTYVNTVPRTGLVSLTNNLVVTSEYQGGGPTQNGSGIVTDYTGKIYAMYRGPLYMLQLSFANPNALGGNSTSGTLYDAYAGNGTPYGPAGDLVITSSTNSVAFMYNSCCNSERFPVIAKLGLSFNLATDFGSTDGVVNTSGIVIETTLGLGYYSAVALQANGKIVVAGWTTEFVWTMARYNINGSRDATFVGFDLTGVLRDTASPFNSSVNGFIYTTTIDQSGNLVVGGQYNSGALSIRYTNTAGRSGTFGNNGVANLTALATTATVQKIINSGTGYLGTGVSTTSGISRFTTFKLTSTGGFDIAFNGNGVVVETTVGASAGYDLLLNGTALAVAGFSNTNIPTVINYHSGTGAFGSLQQFASFGTGSIYGLQKTTNTYAAGQGTNIAFVKALVDGTGLLQDTEPPFATGQQAQIYGGITDKDGNIVLCGNYNNIFTVIRYTGTGARTNSFDGDGVAQYSLASPSNAYSVLQDSVGSYYVVGEITVASTTTLALLKYTNTGTLDTSFGVNGVAQLSASFGQSRGFGLAQNTVDGSLLVAGQVTVDGQLVPAFVLFDASGNVATQFGSQGVQTFSNYGPGSLYASLVSPSLFATGAGGISNLGSTATVATLVQVGQGSGTVAQIDTGF